MPEAITTRVARLEQGCIDHKLYLKEKFDNIDTKLDKIQESVDSLFKDKHFREGYNTGRSPFFRGLWDVTLRLLPALIGFIVGRIV